MKRETRLYYMIFSYVLFCSFQLNVRIRLCIKTFLITPEDNFFLHGLEKARFSGLIGNISVKWLEGIFLASICWPPSRNLYLLSL